MLKGSVLWIEESTNARRIWDALRSKFPNAHTQILIDVYEDEFKAKERAGNPFAEVYLDFVKELRSQANANHRRICAIISNL